jgi:hypothetical protein
MGRTIPIKPIANGAAAAAEDAHVRLQRAGFMRMTDIREPRLSEFVAAFRARGYEVKVVPYEDERPAGDSGSDAGSGEGQICGTIYVRRHDRPTGESDKG